jgi:hypothetical protein
VQTDLSALIRRVLRFENGSRASVRADMASAPLFVCYGCESSFADAPPTLRVQYESGELRFCSESCALDEGFAAAVEAYRDAECGGEGSGFVWNDYRYDQLEALV